MALPRSPVLAVLRFRSCVNVNSVIALLVPALPPVRSTKQSFSLRTTAQKAQKLSHTWRMMRKFARSRPYLGDASLLLKQPRTSSAEIDLLQFLTEVEDPACPRCGHARLGTAVDSHRATTLKWLHMQSADACGGSQRPPSNGCLPAH